MLQGLREESILEPLNLVCLKPLHYLEYPIRLFASVQAGQQAKSNYTFFCHSELSMQCRVDPDPAVQTTFSVKILDKATRTADDAINW
jgi:hypothetical protein